MSPSSTKNGSASMAWICTGTPAGHGRPELRRPARRSRTAAPRGPRPGLGQLLRRHHPEREPGVDELGRQPVGGPHPTLDDLAEADLAGVGHALVERVERAAVVEVGACTVCPARRSSSAKARNPSVWPCAWWNSSTSAMAAHPIDAAEVAGRETAPASLRGPFRDCALLELAEELLADRHQRLLRGEVTLDYGSASRRGPVPDLWGIGPWWGGRRCGRTRTGWGSR